MLNHFFLQLYEGYGWQGEVLCRIGIIGEEGPILFSGNNGVRIWILPGWMLGPVGAVPQIYNNQGYTNGVDLPIDLDLSIWQGKFPVTLLHVTGVYCDMIPKTC